MSTQTMTTTNAPTIAAWLPVEPMDGDSDQAIEELRNYSDALREHRAAQSKLNQAQGDLAAAAEEFADHLRAFSTRSKLLRSHAVAVEDAEAAERRLVDAALAVVVVVESSRKALRVRGKELAEAERDDLVERLAEQGVVGPAAKMARNRHKVSAETAAMMDAKPTWPIRLPSAGKPGNGWERGHIVAALERRREDLRDRRRRRFLLG